MTRLHPAVISCSNFVFKRPSDWNENIHQSGYWFVEEQTDYTPSKELSNFLDSVKSQFILGLAVFLIWMKKIDCPN